MGAKQSKEGLTFDENWEVLLDKDEVIKMLNLRRFITTESEHPDCVEETLNESCERCTDSGINSLEFSIRTAGDLTSPVLISSSESNEIPIVHEAIVCSCDGEEPTSSCSECQSNTNFNNSNENDTESESQSNNIFKQVLELVPINNNTQYHWMNYESFTKHLVRAEEHCGCESTKNWNTLNADEFLKIDCGSQIRVEDLISPRFMGEHSGLTNQDKRMLRFASIKILEEKHEWVFKNAEVKIFGVKVYHFFSGNGKNKFHVVWLEGEESPLWTCVAWENRKSMVDVYDGDSIWSKDGGVTKVAEYIPVVGLVVSLVHASYGDHDRAKRALAKSMRSLLIVGGVVAGTLLVGVTAPASVPILALAAAGAGGLAAGGIVGGILGDITNAAIGSTIEDEQIKAECYAWDQIGESIPIAGYVNSAVHAACGNEEAAKRAFAKCNNTTLSSTGLIVGAMAGPLGAPAAFAMCTAVGAAGGIAGHMLEAAQSESISNHDIKKDMCEVNAKDLAIAGVSSGIIGFSMVQTQRTSSNNEDIICAPSPTFSTKRKSVIALPHADV